MFIARLFWLAIAVLTITLFAACRTTTGGSSYGTAGTSMPAASAADAGTMSLDPVLSGFSDPVFVTHAGDGSDRLFVVEQAGAIRVASDGELLAVPYLDITDRVTSEGNEQGVLGLAFHPEFESNGLFYVYYTAASDGANTLARYHAEPDADRADTSSEQILLAIADDRANHNGGMLAFGPDGYLYIGTGDGGFGHSDNGQRRDVLLGKILRLDVDAGEPYAVPTDNPFMEEADARDEIWAYGLRNPWRFSFDRATGDLYIADVGAVDREEINVQPASSTGGENYGWDIMEGMHCHEPDTRCDRDGLTLPVADYDHDDGCSITGGYVYRGETVSSLRGTYLYADYCSGTIWSLHRDPSGDWVSTQRLTTEHTISSFGEDEAGELYLTDHDEGAVYQIVATGIP